MQSKTSKDYTIRNWNVIFNELEEGQVLVRTVIKNVIKHRQHAFRIRFLIDHQRLAHCMWYLESCR
jgi:hypothetical protein